MTGDCEGGVYFAILLKKDGKEEHVDAELIERGETFESTPGELTPLNEVLFKTKIARLKICARKDKAASGESVADDEKMVIIKPKSDKMKELLAVQAQIMDERRANKMG